VDWHLKGHFFHGEQRDNYLRPLMKSHRLSILKQFYKQSHISLEEKEKLKESILGTDQSDININVAHTCRASLPDPSIKEEVWNQLVDPESQLSLYQKKALMEGFHQWD
jgi:hypothetical protein